VAVLSDNELWVAGMMVLAHSVDGGATWTKVAKPIGLLWSLRFIDPMTAIAAGTTIDIGCGFELTTDGGNSWTTVKAPFKEFPFAATLAPNKLDGVAGLVGGRVLRTHDGGKTWLDDGWPTFLSWTDARYAGGSFVLSAEMGGILRGPAAAQ